MSNELASLSKPAPFLADLAASSLIKPLCIYLPPGGKRNGHIQAGKEVGCYSSHRFYGVAATDQRVKLMSGKLWASLWCNLKSYLAHPALAMSLGKTTQKSLEL